MHKAILLCLLLALVHQVFSQCSSAPKVTLIERPGQWEEKQVLKRIFDLHITNTDSCTLKAVNIEITTPYGSRIQSSWGMNPTNTQVPNLNLAKDAVHSGAGFIYSGIGQPTAVGTPAACNCDGSEITPQKPTTAPTVPPVVTPTNPATNAPTETPTTPPIGDYYTLGLKFAIFTCNATDIRLNVAKNVLDAVGSQYKVFVGPTWGSGLLELNNEDGSGRYYAFVSTTETNCWNAAQNAQIAQYQADNHVKMVILYTYPYETNGLANTQSITVAESDNSVVTFSEAFKSSAAALVSTAQIPVFGVYAYLTTIGQPSLAKEALTITHGGNTYVAGAFISRDGYERLEIYVDQADWATFPVILGTAWLQWVTNGVFAGARRVEFNAHMDDIFMATGMFDVDASGESEDPDKIYRIDVNDMTKTVEWQDHINTLLPSGSNFTLTFPYNGATVLEKGGYDGDDLFIYTKTVKEKFIWESHTYTHPYLDNMTYQGVMDELTNNIECLQELFDVEDIKTIPQYNTRSIITPSISGMFNGRALKAISDFGFKFVVGDNSRPELVPSNLYHVLNSTEAANGFAGMYIVPRHATNIYYDGSLPEHIESQFNWLYSEKLGQTFTFEEIVQRDVTIAVKSLLSFRHDPFMFHQANLRFSNDEFPGHEDTCLMCYWVEQVTTELDKYMRLPLISRKHDDLGQSFLDRQSRDECGFVGTLKLDKDSHAAVGLSAKSDKSCLFGVSGVKAQVGDKVFKYEEYGSSEKTIWLNMDGSSEADVVFSERVAPIKTF